MGSLNRSGVGVLKRCAAALCSPIKAPDPIKRWLYMHTATAIFLRAVLLPLLVGYFLACMPAFSSAFVLLVGSVAWIVRTVARQRERAESRFARGVLVADSKAEVRRVVERVLALGLVWAVIAVAIAVPKLPDRDIGYLEYDSVPLRVVAFDLENRARECKVWFIPQEIGNKPVTLRTDKSVTLREAVQLVADQLDLDCRIRSGHGMRDSLIGRGYYWVDFRAREWPVESDARP